MSILVEYTPPTFIASRSEIGVPMTEAMSSRVCHQATRIVGGMSRLTFHRVARADESSVVTTNGPPCSELHHLDGETMEIVAHFQGSNTLQAGVNEFVRSRCFLEFSNEAARPRSNIPESIEVSKLYHRSSFELHLPHALIII